MGIINWFRFSTTVPKIQEKIMFWNLASFLSNVEMFCGIPEASGQLHGLKYLHFSIKENSRQKQEASSLAGVQSEHLWLLPLQSLPLGAV